jgi:hypothetical protein
MADGPGAPPKTFDFEPDLCEFAAGQTLFRIERCGVEKAWANGKESHSLWAKILLRNKSMGRVFVHSIP